MAKRKYVAVIYDDESQEKLRDWAERNGFDLTLNYKGEKQDSSDFDFHTTIFYSENEANLRNREIPESSSEVIINGIKMLGEDKDIPVLTISNSGPVKYIRKHFEDLGLEDKWTKWIPHISVSYAKKNIDIDEVDLPDFRPRFNKIVIKDIEE